jgi:hypothetical protein
VAAHGVNPGIYFHFSSKAVNALPNDGLWDTRLA